MADTLNDPPIDECPHCGAACKNWKPCRGCVFPTPDPVPVKILAATCVCGRQMELSGNISVQPTPDRYTPPQDGKFRRDKLMNDMAFAECREQLQRREIRDTATALSPLQCDSASSSRLAGEASLREREGSETTATEARSPAPDTAALSPLINGDSASLRLGGELATESPEGEPVQLGRNLGQATPDQPVDSIAQTINTRFDEKFENEKYRYAYMNAHVRQALAEQIIRLRGERSQEEFAALMGTKQTSVSRMENAMYPGSSVQTLLKVAQAGGAGLVIQFVTIDEWKRWRETNLVPRRPPEREIVGLDELAEVIRSADNGLDGDPLAVTLDESPMIDAVTTTRADADERIMRVCLSVAQTLLERFVIRRRG